MGKNLKYAITAVVAVIIIIAAAEFKKLDDFASKEFINRCKEFKKNPPSKDWDGMWVMNSK